MFTKNKRNYRRAIYTAIVITTCLLIITVMWPQPVEPVAGQKQAEEDRQASSKSTDDSQRKDIQDYFNESEDPDKPVGSNEEDPDAGDDENLPDIGGKTDDSDMTNAGQSYYLVKRAGEQIVVYFCDSSGQTVQLETTEILYEMLGPEDQRLFDEGIKLESQEQLGMLLQDFEG